MEGKDGKEGKDGIEGKEKGQKDGGQEKEKKQKKKKKKSVIVKVPPPPPLLLPPKIVSDLSEANVTNLDREKSTSTPSINAMGSLRQFKPRLSKAESNKNLLTAAAASAAATATVQPSLEPNQRSSLRSDSKVQTVPTIYDSSIYDPDLDPKSESSTPLSRSVELDLSPKTAVNPEDQTTPSLETPRTALNLGLGSSMSIDIREDENGSVRSVRSALTNSYDNLNSGSCQSIFTGSVGNIHVESTENLKRASSLNVSRTDVSNLISSSNNLSHVSFDSGLNIKESSVGGGGVGGVGSGGGRRTKNFETRDDLSIKKTAHFVPRIETTKIILKNLVLSNPNLTTLTESPRSAIYVPSPRKPSRLIKNPNFSSASSLLNAFIKNDTNSILDNILNIDIEKNEDFSENSLQDIDKDMDVTAYDYSSECRSEDNPNLELIKKAFNTELLNYLKGLNVVNEGKIVTVDPQKYKINQRNRLIIDDKDYQNKAINNKDLLLETYEKLYLILADIQLRSKKAKESIEKIKEEHNTLIEEIKIVRDKELKSKEIIKDTPKRGKTVTINEGDK